MTKSWRNNLASSMPLLSSMLVAGILNADRLQFFASIGVGFVFGLAAAALYWGGGAQKDASGSSA